MRDKELKQAADAVSEATALVVSAGAGMGVDSGLPDFRGDKGFWRAYPAYEKLGLSFSDMANPKWFEHDPELAWGFYGHRLELYRATQPHTGFDVLLRWTRRMSHGCRVFTSNVDGQFQKAGFDQDRIEEHHGSIHHLQCTADCGAGIFEATTVRVDVDPDSFRARGALPTCPRCGELARPNILMFGDWQWDHTRTEAQQKSWLNWLRQAQSARAKVVVVECGAGLAIPTVRRFSETLVRAVDATLIRINVRDWQVPAGQIALANGARESLHAIDAFVAR